VNRPPLPPFDRDLCRSFEMRFRIEDCHPVTILCDALGVA
jgi:hypothetical protein